MGGTRDKRGSAGTMLSRFSGGTLDVLLSIGTVESRVTPRWMILTIGAGAKEVLLRATTCWIVDGPAMTTGSGDVDVPIIGGTARLTPVSTRGIGDVDTLATAGTTILTPVRTAGIGEVETLATTGTMAWKPMTAGVVVKRRLCGGLYRSRKTPAMGRD